MGVVEGVQLYHMGVHVVVEGVQLYHMGVRMWDMSNCSNMASACGADFFFLTLVFLLVSPASFVGSEQD